MKTIKVQAQPGRTFPLDAGANPSGGFTLIKPGETAEVYLTSEVRRGLRDGDLIDLSPKPVPTPSPLRPESTKATAPAAPATASTK